MDLNHKKLVKILSKIQLKCVLIELLKFDSKLVNNHEGGIYCTIVTYDYYCIYMYCVTLY
jgi:hypothetical protein